MVEEEKRFPRYEVGGGLIVDKSKRCVTAPNAKVVPKALGDLTVSLSCMMSGIHITLWLPLGMFCDEESKSTKVGHCVVVKYPTPSIPTFWRRLLDLMNKLFCMLRHKWQQQQLWANRRSHHPLQDQRLDVDINFSADKRYWGIWQYWKVKKDLYGDAASN